MVTIDTEFKSDLASIQQHINDLDSKATTLNDCVSDFSGGAKAREFRLAFGEDR